ncbi:hypothetical protein ACFVAM_02180, partial [Streptomyces californicus]
FHPDLAFTKPYLLAMANAAPRTWLTRPGRSPFPPRSARADRVSAGPGVPPGPPPRPSVPREGRRGSAGSGFLAPHPVITGMVVTRTIRLT